MCDARRTVQVPIKQGATGQSRERAGKGASNPFVKTGGKVESIPFMKVGKGESVHDALKARPPQPSPRLARRSYASWGAGCARPPPCRGAWTREPSTASS